MKNPQLRYLAVGLWLLLLSGCQTPTPEQSSWTGRLHRADGKDIPFHFYLDIRNSSPNAYFLTGDERTPVPEIQHQGDSLIFVFSEYSAAMRGRLQGTRWQGDYIRYRTTPLAIPFESEAESPGHSDTAQSTAPAIPLVGKFQALLRDGNQVDSTTVATFWARKDSVFGTLIAPDGDYGLNVGTQHGTTVTLSRFTGWQAQLFEFRQEGTSWAGMFYVRNEPPEQVTLVPRPTLREHIPAVRVTTIKTPDSRFRFSGITVDGDTLSSLSAQFKGKALIVDIMGTWCHNCMDEAPVLQQLYEEYRTKGLEVVGLSYEINDDASQGRRNLSLYQKRYGLTFPLLFCGSTGDSYVGPQIRSQLNNFYAYPTALFIDRKGHVRSIHIGFKGPGTGEEFQSEVKELYEIVSTIIKD